MQRLSLATRFACALREDRRVACWGDGTHGQLGRHVSTSDSVPAVVADLGSVTALCVGEAHACAVLESGRVACWGAAAVGQLGSGDRTDHTSPVIVDGVTVSDADPV